MITWNGTPSPGISGVILLLLVERRTDGMRPNTVARMGSLIEATPLPGPPVYGGPGGPFAGTWASTSDRPASS